MSRSELPLDILPDVAAALAERRPVVALESTIITHGMPYPDNVATARAVEADVREAGAMPATIVVSGGRIRIGLPDAELERLGRATDVMKLSRADLAFALALGREGSTTVAATMICAAAAGIQVFATGGIGGVHRGYEATLDVSGRPRRTRAHAGRGRLCGRQGAPRPAADPRISGDAGRAGRGLRNRPVSGFLEPR